MTIYTWVRKHIRLSNGPFRVMEFPDSFLDQKLLDIEHRNISGTQYTLKHKFVSYRDIYETFFKYVPLRVAYAIKKYGLHEKKVLDVGCNFGQALIHFGEGSVGLELDLPVMLTARALGIRNMIRCDVEKEQWPVRDKSFDAVYCSNLLEHALSPHLLLRKAHKALKRNGLLFVGVPLMPKQKASEKLIKWLSGLGYAHKYHINAFTRRTLCFTVERAGFEIIACGVFLAALGPLNKILGPLIADISCQTMCVARKVESKK